MKLPLTFTMSILLLAGTHATAATKAAATEKPAAKVVQPNVKPGLWEISTVVETRGMDAKRTIVSRICYAAEDVQTIENLIPRQDESGMKCALRDVKFQPNEASWRSSCTGKDSTSSGTGKMTLSGEAFAAQVHLDLTASKKTAKVEQTIAGKRVGDCK